MRIHLWGLMYVLATPGYLRVPVLHYRAFAHTLFNTTFCCSVIMVVSTWHKAIIQGSILCSGTVQL